VKADKVEREENEKSQYIIQFFLKKRL